MKGTIPAFVKSSVGSPWGTSEALATRVCPFDSKKRRNVSRISRAGSDLGTEPLDLDARGYRTKGTFVYEVYEAPEIASGSCRRSLVNFVDERLR